MQEFKEQEPGLRDALPLKKAQELASGQLGALRDARGGTGLGMIMLHKAETERGRGGAAQTRCVQPPPVPKLEWPWSCFPTAAPHVPFRAVCAAAAPADRVKGCVFEEEGSLPSLEPGPQLSKGLQGQFSASLCPRGSPFAVSPTAFSTLQKDK